MGKWRASACWTGLESEATELTLEDSHSLLWLYSPKGLGVRFDLNQ